MKAIIKRELKNYLKNPILWIGLLLIVVALYQILNPYLQLHYFGSDQEIEEVGPESAGDVDIMEGYIQSTAEEQMQLACERTKAELAEALGISDEEADRIFDKMRRDNMTIDEMTDYLGETYHFYAEYGMEYYYAVSDVHKGTAQEANTYIEQSLKEHSFTWYFARKFADFAGLFLGFFATVLLAFLFIRDTRSDTYELLHTKPVSAGAYVCGKVGGGFLVMVLAWGILMLFFGALCIFHGVRNGFPVRPWDFLITAAVYILPNMLMITCVYTAAALIFKNPLPAVPCLFLYLVYSNMGSVGPDGNYGYYGRPLAIMVRFPGRFFETTPPPLALWNQTFLICVSAVIVFLSVLIWERRRVY